MNSVKVTQSLLSKRKPAEVTQGHTAKGWQSWNGVRPELNSATRLALAEVTSGLRVYWNYPRA